MTNETGAQAMGTRDEALKAINDAVNYYGGGDYPDDGEILDALVTEGWRKKPSRDEIIEAIYATSTPRGIPKTSEWPYPVTVTELADAILALMDRGQ